MATASFEGTIGYISRKRNGVTFTLAEGHWECKQKTVFRLAAWGKLAQNLERKLKSGKRFRFTCRIEVNTANGSTYTNFTVTSWAEVILPARQPQPSQPEQSDDWFEPTMRDRDSSSARRYEGYPA